MQQASCLAAWILALFGISIMPSTAMAMQDVTFRMPSTLTLSASQSSTETKSAAAALRLMLPKNFWVEVAADQAIESFDGFETKTLGSSISVGTDPIEDYAFDIGLDAFGVVDQYQVREGRIRVAAMPLSLLGWMNPGIELALEYRQAIFEFTNQPNPIFNSSVIQLNGQTLRTELGFYMLSPLAVRLFFERISLDQGFQDLNRPLAPIFIPEAAISTAVTWPKDEDGISLSYLKRQWGARVAVSQKTAAVTSDKTITVGLGIDYRWNRKFSTTLRYMNSKSQNDSTLPAIDSFGLEFALNFY